MNAVRGFKDILPKEAKRWSHVEARAREVFYSFGFDEIRTPVLEKTEVFTRGIGEHTDIVEKEMYTFPDRNGESLSLRPEATAGVIRAVIENKLHASSSLLKLFTIGPMFRHERPQKGRLRQFHQIDAEIIGTSAPLSDAEVILSAWEILSGLGVVDARLEINSLGCPLCRPVYREKLNAFLHGIQAHLCPDCQRRSAANPLRVFDCKQDCCKEALRQAPVMKDHLCADCAGHFERVLAYSSAFNMPFTINPYLVRGLDYYVRTTFEMVSARLGAQGTVAAGGRYDGLVTALGGPDLPGVGMAVGLERLMLLIADKDGGKGNGGLFVAALGEEARKRAVSLLHSLRKTGLAAQMPYEEGKGLKAQLKEADRQGASFALIVGENELETKKLILRNLVSHEQQEVALDDNTAVTIRELAS